jgi:putative ABC transport system permease protein
MALLADLARDLRYAARSLLRTPGFTVVAVAVLALGIGATSAIASLVSAMWLKPLPFADAERVVSVWIDGSAGGGPARGQLTPAHYADWRDRAQSFEEMAPVEPATVNLTGDGGEPERLMAVRSTPNLFATIGLEPIVGRTFVAEDGASEAVVVSEGFWLRRFGGDPAAVGRTITLDGVPHEVVGVVPRDFRFPIFPVAEKDVFIATAFPPEILANRGNFSWFSVAKLRAGVSLEAAEAELRTIAAALNAETPNTMPRTPALVPLRETLARSVGPSDRDVGPTLFALLGAVALVLLIACANVANLMLARATVRQKELAIRKALGAARGRVLRQLLTESALLAGVSVLLGLGLAAASFGYLRRLLPDTLPASADLTLDWRVLALTAGAALVTVLLFGAGPALAAARRDFGAAFGRSVGTQGAGARRLRTALVVAEIALTVVLLAGAGLLLRSYAAVLAVDPGFDADGLLVVDTPLSPTRYGSPADRDAFYQRVLERVRALPGVESAGYTNFAPLVIEGGLSVVFHEGRPLTMAEIQRMPPGELQRLLASNRGVSPGYLETLGVPLVSGRSIDARDSRDAPPVAVINQTMARTFWPDADPLGRRFRMGVGGDTLFTVVGVVGDMKAVGLDVPAFAEAYLPADQLTFPFMWPQQLVARSSGDPLALANAVRQVIRDIDPDQPVSRVGTMNEVIDADLESRNTQLTLIGSFAVIALLLAAVGLYGVLSYTVSQTTAEIGLRMALGAEQSTVVGTVVRSALGAAVLGIGAGLVAASALTRTIASFLYGVSPTDPATAAAVAGVLLAVAALAAFVPARRAASVDPAVTLRAEA